MPRCFKKRLCSGCLSSKGGTSGRGSGPGATWPAHSSPDVPVLKPDLHDPHVQARVGRQLLADVAGWLGALAVCGLQFLQLTGTDGGARALATQVVLCKHMPPETHSQNGLLRGPHRVRCNLANTAPITTSAAPPPQPRKAGSCGSGGRAKWLPGLETQGNEIGHSGWELKS